jgi:hypothetical protein
MDSKPEIVVILKLNAGQSNLALPTMALAKKSPSVIDRLNKKGIKLKQTFAHSPNATLSFGAPMVGAPQEMLKQSDEVAELVRDQARYFHVVESKGSVEQILKKLKSDEEVEAAYLKPPTSNPLAPEKAKKASGPANPQALSNGIPDFLSLQGYLADAPAGIGARVTWKIPGGMGDDVNVIDIEGGWRFTHVDLLKNSGGLVGGSSYDDVDWRNHGTAVVGQIGGDFTDFGVTGIAPNARLSAIAHGGLGSAQAINLAAQKLRSGDVLLLEMHRPGPRYNYQDRKDQKGFIPVEWWPDDYSAIRLATAKGIIVVEAAGNGGENLNDPIYDKAANGFPQSWRNPFATSGVDSGAILVGAGAPSSGHFGPYRSRLDFSNFGSRLDCQGWGREVVTTGYGDLYRAASDIANEDYWYTAAFSGTSSASPIVTGAICSLQGIARKNGKILSPAQVREALRTTGSPQASHSAAGAIERIGSLPNLRELRGYFQLP